MSHSGNPVFLVLGAEGSAEEPLPNVDGEVLLLEKLVELKTGGDLDIKVRTSVRHHHVTALAQIYLPRLSFLHFAGHGENGQVNTQDFAFSAKNLAQIIKTNSSNSRIRFVFLNACDTAIMVDPFHKAGIDHIIATTAKVNDELARKFAENFYTAFFHVGKSFIESFYHAKASIPEESGVKVEHKKRRGAVFLWSKFRKKNLWGLYSRSGSKDFSLNDVIPPKQELTSMPESRKLPVEELVSMIDRKEQDTALRLRILSGEKQRGVTPTTLDGSLEHLPQLYFIRLHNKPGYTTLEYTFPEALTFTAETVFSGFESYLGKQRGRWTYQKKNLIDLLNSAEDEVLIVHTSYLWTKSSRSGIDQVIQLHDAFWKQIHIPGKRIVAILVMSTGDVARTGRKLIDENAASANDFMPALHTINTNHLKNWELNPDVRGERLINKLKHLQYQDEIAKLPTCPEGGFHLFDILKKIENLLTTPLTND